MKIRCIRDCEISSMQDFKTGDTYDDVMVVDSLTVGTQEGQYTGKGYRINLPKWGVFFVPKKYFEIVPTPETQKAEAKAETAFNVGDKCVITQSNGCEEAVIGKEFTILSMGGGQYETDIYRSVAKNNHLWLYEHHFKLAPPFAPHAFKVGDRVRIKTLTDKAGTTWSNSNFCVGDIKTISRLILNRWNDEHEIYFKDGYSISHTCLEKLPDDKPNIMVNVSTSPFEKGDYWQKPENQPTKSEPQSLAVKSLYF